MRATFISRFRPRDHPVFCHDAEVTFGVIHKWFLRNWFWFQNIKQFIDFYLMIQWGTFDADFCSDWIFWRCIFWDKLLEACFGLVTICCNDIFGNFASFVYCRLNLPSVKEGANCQNIFQARHDIKLDPHQIFAATNPIPTRRVRLCPS